jgi:hypothetical protein
MILLRTATFMTVTQTRPFDLRLTFAATKKPNPTTKLVDSENKNEFVNDHFVC